MPHAAHNIRIADHEPGFRPLWMDSLSDGHTQAAVASIVSQRTVWQFMPSPPQGQPERRSVTNADVQRELRRIYIESIRALVAAVEAKDPYTEKHSVVVSYYCEVLAHRLRLSPQLVETLQTAAILHDIGKIGIPDAILKKPAPLTRGEFDTVRMHPQRAVQIIEHASFLSAELPLVLHHHERYDGWGYPRGLAGEAIPLGARVLAVADSIDTMLSPRSYKPSYDIEHVRRELTGGAGRQFDPDVAAVADEWLRDSPGDIVIHPIAVPAG
jgi:HD-GYP domain-containing protein (c-di-GMP phosphodiesterase class II)